MVTTQDGKIRHYIVYGGVSTADYRCYCNGSESFGAPERDIETIEIPGRNGALTYDKGRFKDVSVKYSMFFEDIKEFEDWKNKVRAKRGATRLDDSHHPMEYRLATISGTLEPSVGGYNNEYCSCDVTFTAKPQRFLVSGEREISYTSSGNIYNPTDYPALPKVIVYKGSVSVRIGSNSIQIDSVPSSYECMVIDCEEQDAYYISSSGTVNANSAIQLGGDRFWSIEPGENVVQLSSSSAKIGIIPRWWTI